MGNPYELFKTSQDAENAGILVNYGDFAIKVKRAGEGNKAFKRAFTSFSKRHKTSIDMETLDDDVAKAALIKIFAEHVLVDWVGVCGEDGEALEFNSENATKLLTDLPALFQDLRQRALDFRNFRTKELESLVGN